MVSPVSPFSGPSRTHHTARIVDTNLQPQENLPANIVEKIAVPPEKSEKNPHKTTKSDSSSVKDKIKTLEQASKDIEAEIEKITTGIALLTVDISDEFGNQLGESLLETYQAGQSLNEISVAIHGQLESFLKLTPKEQKVLNEHGKITALLSSASDILEILQNSSILAQKEGLIEEKKTLLNQKREDLKTADPSTAKILEKEIQIIEQNLRQEIFETDNTKSQLILKSGLILPDLADSIYAAVKLFGNIAHNPIISSTIGVAGSIAGVAATGVDVVRTTKNESSHAMHTADLTSPSVVIENTDKKILEHQELEKLKDREVELQQKFDLTDNEKTELNQLPKKIADLQRNIDLSPITNVKYVQNQELDKLKEMRIKIQEQSGSNESIKKITKEIDALEREIETKPIPRMSALREISGPQVKIFDMYHRRRQVFEARFAEESKLFDEIRQDNNNDFAAFKEALSNNGISLKYPVEVDGEILTKEITSFNDLDVKGVKDKLLKGNVDRKDTLSVMAKNQLKARFQASEEINHKFFSFKRLRSQAFFGVSVLTSIATISTTALTLAAVAFPPALLAIPAILGIAATVGAIALGLYHLHKHKPNIAETIVKMVKPRIMLNQTLILFSEFNLKIAEFSQYLLEKKVDAFANSKFDQENLKTENPNEFVTYMGRNEYFSDEGFFKDITAEQTEIDDKVKYWTDKKANYEKNIAGLEEKIIEARKKDFDRTGFDSFGTVRIKNLEKREKELLEKPDLTTQEGAELLKVQNEIGKLAREKKDDFYVLAEALVEGEFWKDPEAAAFIKKYGGVELEKELKLHSETKSGDIEFINQKLRAVILRNSGEILKWVEKQNMKEVQI